MPETVDEPRTGRRRTFGPVVLLGVAAAGLAAVAGSQPWARGSGTGIGELSATVEAGRVPAANALALVVLACWGVLLVTRGPIVRRIPAAIAVVAAVGFLVSVVTGWASAPDGVRDAYLEVGVSDPDVSRSPWYVVAALAGLLTLATTALALRLVPEWPQMGRRYDAPTEQAAPVAASTASPEDRENLELWKAIDEGRDPTD